MKKSLFLLGLLLPFAAMAQMGTSGKIKPRIGIVIINPEDMKKSGLATHNSQIVDIIKQIKANGQLQPLIGIEEIQTNNANLNDTFKAIAEAAQSIKNHIAKAETTALNTKEASQDLHTLHNHLVALQNAAQEAGISQKIQHSFQNLRAALNEALQNEAAALEQRAQELKNNGQTEEAKRVRSLATVLKRKPKTKLLGSRTEQGMTRLKKLRSGRSSVKMMNTYNPQQTEGASAY